MTDEHAAALKTAGEFWVEHFSRYRGYPFSSNSDESDAIEDIADLVLRVEREAKIEALMWARKHYMGVPYNLTRGIEAEIARLEGDRAAIDAAFDHD